MDKRVAVAFYIIVGVLGIGLAWLSDARQTAPAAVTETPVKQQVLPLKASDFEGESQDVQNAIHNLMQAVPKPGGDTTSDQLQPALGNSDAHQSPQ